MLTLFQQIVAGSPTLSDELSTVAANIEDAGRMVDFIASSLPSLSTRDKQDVLETPDVQVRLEKINQHLAKELEVQQLRNKIQSEVQDRVQQTQREYYLREQMKAIQKELGEQDETTRDAEELRQKIEAGGHARRREERGAEGTGPAGAHVADGRRLRPHAQLHRVAGGAAVAEVVGRRGRHPEGQGDPRLRSLRSGEGEGPHSGLPFGAPSEAEHEGADPVLRRTSGRGQDLAGQVDCARAGTQVRAPVAGRRA